MIRILLYPNIALPKKNNTLQDRSYIEFLSLFINQMNIKRSDIFWYIILPSSDSRDFSELEKLRKSLYFSNTYFINLNIPDYPLNRIHFDVNELKQKLKLDQYPIDLIFSHQPEISRKFKLFFNIHTNLNPPLIGYLHLFELPKINWEGIFEYTIFGITEMESCFVNTAYQKQLVFEEARKIFKSSICGQLHEKLEMFPDTIIPKNIKTNKSGTYEKIIVWNHTVDEKKNFLDFEKTILTLRKKRNDFKVWFPMMKDTHRLSKEYRWIINNNCKSKKEYFKILRKCCVGVSPKKTYGEWLDATIEGNLCGIPYIVYDESYYKEYNNAGDYFKTRKQLLLLLNTYLDNSNYRNEMASKAISNYIIKYNTMKKVEIVSRKINSIQNKKKTIRSKLTNKIISIIKNESEISHKELLGKKFLDWDPNIKFDRYRKSILKTKGIIENDYLSKSKKHRNKRFNWKSVYRYEKR